MIFLSRFLAAARQKPMNKIHGKQRQQPRQPLTPAQRGPVTPTIDPAEPSSLTPTPDLAPLMRSIRLHYLPPNGPTVPVLERAHMHMALRLLAVVSTVTMLAAWVCGLVTLSHVIATPIAVALAGQAVQAEFAGATKFQLDNGCWWRILRRATVFGGMCAASGVGAIVMLGNAESMPSHTGLLLPVTIALFSNSVMAPAATVLLLARMRDRHAEQYPLNGAGGELEA